MLFVGLAFTLSACRSEQSEQSITFYGVDDKAHALDEPFEPLNRVYAIGINGEDLREHIEVDGEVDTESAGEYELSYTVSDDEGNEKTRSRVISVYPKAEGTYDFRYADDELKHSIISELEHYIYNNINDRVTIMNYFQDHSIIHESVNLPVDEPLPILGWAYEFSSRQTDDDEKLLNLGFFARIESFNLWDESEDLTLERIHWSADTLYYYGLNENNDETIFKSGLANDEPVIIDGTSAFGGPETGTIIEIPIYEDLAWNYHYNTETYEFEEDHETLDAYVIEQSIKTALEQDWYHVSESLFDADVSIKNLEPYYDQYQRAVQQSGFIKPEWDMVGIEAKDAHTLRIELDEPRSKYDVMAFFAQRYLTPINHSVLELAEANDHSYGDSPEYIAYSGPYSITSYVEHLVVRFVENESFHDPNRHAYTNIDVRRYQDSGLKIEAFENENLHAIFPTTYYFDYWEDDDTRIHPHLERARIYWRIDNNESNEPILEYNAFQKALSYAIDRQEYTQLSPHYQPALSEIQRGLITWPSTSLQAYHNSPYKENLNENLHDNTDGFNESLAESYWEKAINKAIVDGHYKSGETITINLQISERIYPYLDTTVQNIESIFQSELHDVDVEISLILFEEDIDEKPTIHIEEYYYYFYDYKHATSNLDSNFYINHSNETHDSSEFTILLSYEKDGETIEELWSYEALSKALNSRIEIKDGEITS